MLYDNPDFDIVGAAINAASAIALSDRKKYMPFLTRAERFAADNRMVVGGAGGLRALTGDVVVPLDGYSFELYSPTPKEHAHRLAAALYEVDPGGLGRYACATTNTPHEEYTIFVTGREVARVLSLGERDIAKTVIPVPRPGAFGGVKELLYLPPEVQLIALYAALCNPEKAEEWEKLLTQEAELRKVFLQEFKGKIRDVVGGGDKAWYERRDRLIAALSKALTLHVQVPHSGSRRYFIASDAMRDVQQLVLSVAEKERVQVHMDLANPHIPGTPQMRRLTVHALGNPNGRREPIIYVYNAASYELVPYVEASGARMASIFVNLRFALIDLWTAQLLMHIKAITAGVAADLISDILRAYSAESAKIATTPNAKLFPLTYIGRAVNPITSAKRAKRDTQKKRFIPTYFPMQQKSGNSAAS